MAKYADTSNQSDDAVNRSKGEASEPLNESCRADCDSQEASDAFDDDFSVDGTRPYF